ncbi:LppM family (lipo)protein [Halobacillus sp. B23F22_1]|uniref:LppM family (lipo)protein n=1 Tax=Halobacillus sp. B23F22_1 TaxID=3459514 RepID=UPI00373F949B
MNKRMILAMIMLALLLAGCVKGDFAVKINKDGSGVNTITIGVEEVTFAQFGGDEGMLDETNQDLEAQGYTIEELDEEGYIGITATKEFEDAGEMDFIPDTDTIDQADMDASAAEEDINFSVEEGFFTDTYRLEGSFDLEGAFDLGGVEQMIANQMDLTFTLDLPIQAKEHNADEEDGSVLAWDINPTGSNDIMVEADAPNVRNIIIVGVAALAVIGVVIFLVMRKKGKPNKEGQ